MQKVASFQNLVTNQAEAREVRLERNDRDQKVGGTGSDVDATTASTLHEETILVRRALREPEPEQDGWQFVDI